MRLLRKLCRYNIVCLLGAKTRPKMNVINSINVHKVFTHLLKHVDCKTHSKVFHLDEIKFTFNFQFILDCLNIVAESMWSITTLTN